MTQLEKTICLKIDTANQRIAMMEKNAEREKADMRKELDALIVKRDSGGVLSLGCFVIGLQRNHDALTTLQDMLVPRPTATWPTRRVGRPVLLVLRLQAPRRDGIPRRWLPRL